MFQLDGERMRISACVFPHAYFRMHISGSVNKMTAGNTYAYEYECSSYNLMIKIFRVYQTHFGFGCFQRIMLLIQRKLA